MIKKIEPWYVYMVQCSDATYYIGTTNNVAKRIKKHNVGKGAKYTKGRNPVEIKYVKEFVSRAEACKKEYQLKQISKAEKNNLAQLFQDEKTN